MCGINGFWSRAQLTPGDARSRVEHMRDTMCHRGPDDAGSWLQGRLAFGHRRLSIVDLSPLGHQPMSGAGGRYTICFNGEIFNFLVLRDELAARGHSFAGGSDTEVMLAAFLEWGVHAAVTRFVGMFAFAVWDESEHVLHLVRDRMGIKPLFVGRTAAGDIVFASELKGLMGYPGMERRIDSSAAAAFLRFAYVPAPQSILAGVVKLLPGHILSLRAQDAPLEPRPYWSLEDVARDGRLSLFTGSLDDAEDELDTLLREVVGLRMIADVPLGAFLSGGNNLPFSS